MRQNHLGTWVGTVCLLCAAAVGAQQDQTVAMVGSPSEPTVGSSAGVTAVPRLIKFSGAVRDARGEPVTNVAARLTFAVYEEQTGGAAIWAEAHIVELDEQGHYAVLLGATRADGLPVELFPAGKARWLGVQVEGRDEDPRVLLVSVPYALKAGDAAMLGGRSAADFVLGEQLKEEVRTQVEAQKPGIATQAVEMLVSNPPNLPAIADGPSTFTCATTGDCVGITQNGTGRALRTTAASASEAILIQQNGTGYGLRALAPGNIGVLGQITGSAGTSYGVKGQTTSTTGAGVFGYNLATTGLSYGVLGQTSSTGGTALFGRATATTGATIGLRGHADSTSGTGIVGQATATSGTTTGIVGRVFSANGTALIVDNTQGGKLMSGKVGTLEKFKVDGSGNVYANTYLDLAGNPVGSGSANDLNCVACVSEPEVSFNYAGSSSPGGAATTALTAGTATELTCTGCVSPPEVSFNYAGSSSPGGAATTALAADSATNALGLGGVTATNYARLDVANSFSGNQTFAGNLSLTGTGNLTMSGALNGWAIIPSKTASCIIGSTTYPSCSSANLTGGWAGAGGPPPPPLVQAKSIKPGVVGQQGLTPEAASRGGTTSSLGETAATFSCAAGANCIADGVLGGTIAGGGGIITDSNNTTYTYANTVTNNWGTVGGGANNQAGDSSGAESDACCELVGGGLNNTANAGYAVVGGGLQNTASEMYTTVSGGTWNAASGRFSTVAGGAFNTASGNTATVAGGNSNNASGVYSFAAGCLASAASHGAFVWGGANGPACVSVGSSGDGQFVANAPGGFWLSNATSTPTVSITHFLDTSTGAYLTTSGVWTNNSDRDLKTAFEPLDASSLLARIGRLPIMSWRYKVNSSSVRHVGPMAQDFYAAFGVGEDDKHISTVDADGVALAGVQALHQLSQEKDRIIKAQGEEIKQLSRQLEELRARLARLEQLLP